MYNENMCETCVFAKFDCWYPMGGKVVAGWDDKGVGIIVACKNYEKDNGQSSEYEKEYEIAERGKLKWKWYGDIE